MERQRQQRWRSAPAAKLPPPTPQPSCRSRHHRPCSVTLLPRKSCHRRAACTKLQQPPAATAAARPPAVATTAATTAATTTMMTAVAVAAKATVMATAAASGRHGESLSVLAAVARMETSDKFRGELVDCCLCLCPPPSRRCCWVAAVKNQFAIRCHDDILRTYHA